MSRVRDVAGGGGDSGTGPLKEVSSLGLNALLAEVIERLEDTRDAGNRLQGLLEAVVAIAAGLELEFTLRRIVQAAADLVGAQYGALGVLAPTGGIAEFITVGMDPEQVEQIGENPRGRGILGLLVEHPTPLRLEDLTQHPQASGFPPHHPQMHSFLGVPIRVRGEVFGNLYLTERRQGGRFSHEDEQVVVALAAAAGVAIENARLYQEAQMRASWLRASTDIVTAVLKGAAPDAVLDLVAASAREVAGADLSTIALPTDDNRLVVQHASGEDASDFVGRTVPGGFAGVEVMRSQQSIVVADVAEGASVQSLYAGAYGPAMFVPLVTNERTLGTLVLANHRGGRTFTPEEFVMAEAFAGQAALALVLTEARREQERLAVLEDRDRIGRDLHDLVIQRLFATGMVLQGAARQAGPDSDVTARIERAVGELDATILEVRSTIFALHDGRSAEAAGLRRRVLRELAQAAHTLGFEPTIRFDGPIDSVVGDDVAEHVVAAVREALSNVARHAAASRVRVSLSVDDTDVVVIVTDNGVGLASSGGRRSGLANLSQRAETLGGTCVTEPAEPDGSGTRLIWRAPAR
ncbi:MAG: GAF domain-containing protein [Actinomycetota bacterium]|nr:GAF domain-containing protein [Actinomycetota bacterium]MDH5277799.1 GAF domain-containing protein [Actinomycetota bacterium]